MSEKYIVTLSDEKHSRLETMVDGSKATAYTEFSRLEYNRIIEVKY